MVIDGGKSIAEVIEEMKLRNERKALAIQETRTQHSTHSRHGFFHPLAKKKFPFKFASRLNSFKDREAVLEVSSTGVLGWIAQAVR